MVCITSIAVHDSDKLQRMGLRRALLTRRANLGDCSDPGSVLRRIASPKSLRHPYSIVPLPRRSRGQLSAADLALQVSRQTLEGVAGLDPADVGALIFCHAAPDERIGHSVPGRVQFELGMRRALPFSISQAHNTAMLIALDLAAGLIDGPEAFDAVLVMSADKLLFGEPPHIASDMLWGDVAASAMVTREATSGWRLQHLCLRHVDTPLRAHQAWPSADRRAFAAHGAQVVRDCLGEFGLKPAALAAVVSPLPHSPFAQEVHRLADLPAAKRPGPRTSALRAAHAASPDLLVRLNEVEPDVQPGQAVLAWCHGDNGEFACAVLTRIP